MTKILVVDDESDLEILIKQKFRQKIRQQEYEFIFASNGKQALELVKQNDDIDLVLSDINMPVMDGLTLLSKLSEQNSLLKSVIISAYGDMENIRTAMNRGAFDFITKPVNFRDLEITIEKTMHYVKQIRDTLQAIKENNILRMYVDETVLNFMGSREFESSLLENETIEATVAFIDICGFTAISETETPDKVVKLLNDYFDIMVKEIIQEKGIVDKFIGDAIMAVFKGPFHLDRAIDACLSIRKTIDELPPFDGVSGYKPHVSIGINSGEMVTGNIGSSTLRRLDYTVIGDAVNVAARLQGAAGVSQILITESSYKLINESFVCEKVGEMNFKNKESAITVYQVKN
ncbi:MAG: adenylate/guanylate cyclase [Bacteroidetes bacterium]|nr:MAG: adenylate/guanylate cyclase [Bacteroidota bacterium]